MFRKAMLLAAAAASVAALAVPATAPANWKHGQATLQADASATITGQWRYQGQTGNVECQVIMNAQLTAGTTTGHSQFDVDNGGLVNDEAKCSVGGGTIGLGCTDVEQMTIAGAWTFHAVSTTTIAVTTGTLQFHLTGGALCPKTKQLTPGTIHITTGQDLFEQVQFSGQQQLHAPPGPSQLATISGTASITPSGTFGIA